jgi:adenylate kinase
MSSGGNLVDFHSTSSFPLRWFPLVVVLRCSTDRLFDRLTGRGYSAAKVDENVEAEIMQVCLDEVREGWDEEAIVELQSNTVDDLENNCRWCVQWIAQWKRQKR